MPRTFSLRCAATAMAIATAAIATAALAPAAEQVGPQAPGAAPVARSRHLVDAIAAPMLYFAVQHDGSKASSPGPLDLLLADPALDRLLGVDAPSGASGAVGLLRSVVRRAAGDLELVMTGIVPTGVGHAAVDRPLLVLRTHLSHADAERMRGLLADGQLAVVSRRLGDQTIYALRPDGYALRPDGAAGGGDGPGQRIEVTVVDDDLVVGNDGSAMTELFGGQRAAAAASGAATSAATSAAATSAAPIVASAVLAKNPRFVALRALLPSSPGALLLYGDWPRLGHRLGKALHVDAEHGGGMPLSLLHGSGLGSARTVMATLAAHGSGLQATMLFDCDTAAADIDGWIAATQRVPARELVAELPGSGLGGFVLAVDPDKLIGGSRRLDGVFRLLHAALRGHGLDFDRQVRGRLGKFGTVQLLLTRTDNDGSALSPLYSFRCRSKKAAVELFDDLVRATQTRGIGRIVGRDGRERGKDRRLDDILELSDCRDGRAAWFGQFDGTLVCADSLAAIAALHDEVKAASRAGRARRDAGQSAALQAIGGDKVAGWFDVDLQPWFAQLTSSLEPIAGSSPTSDLVALPTRHIGCVDVLPVPQGLPAPQGQPGPHASPGQPGAVVRLQVLSSL